MSAETDEGRYVRSTTCPRCGKALSPQGLRLHLLSCEVDRGSEPQPTDEDLDEGGDEERRPFQS